MPQLLITRGGTRQITPHFNEKELFSHSADAPASHYFPSEVVAAAEYLRTFFGVRWRFTSTYRTAADERRILENLGQSFFVDVHMKAQAGDSQPVENGPAIMKQLAADFLSYGPIFKHLRTLGITGFGLYDTFIHLDVRTDHRPHKDEFGPFAQWDSRRNNDGSPWGPAFANQKKSPVAATLPSPTPNPATTKPRKVLVTGYSPALSASASRP
jgi:hypothetical protein